MNISNNQIDPDRLLNEIGLNEQKFSPIPETNYHNNHFGDFIYPPSDSSSLKKGEIHTPYVSQRELLLQLTI